MKQTAIITTAALLLSLTSCDWFKAEKKATDIVLNEKSAMLVENNNLFGYNLFEKVLSAEDANKNLMISPLSVSQALSMALNGANESTYEQMKSMLGYEGLSTTDINQSNQTIVNGLESHDPKVKMQIANSVWYRNDFSPKADFISNNKTFYEAEVSSYDPQKPDAAKEKMNNWVEDKTNGKIDQIIDNVSPDNVMFLINAVYFKGEWKTQFKKSQTKKVEFTLDNGTKINTETMIGEVKLSYYNEEKYSVVKLPYGQGKFNMVIFLPEEGYTTTDIAPLISKTNFETLENSTETEREIYFPKFEFSYKNVLNDELAELGMTDAFNSDLADFKNITDAGIYISKVNHKSYIKTDEEGSEAAAATSVEFEFTSIGPEGTIRIDRSFLFAIVEEDTNSILFIGKVYNPSVSE